MGPHPGCLERRAGRLLHERPASHLLDGGGTLAGSDANTFLVGARNDRLRYSSRKLRNCLFPPWNSASATSGVFDSSSSLDTASAARCHAMRVTIRLEASGIDFERRPSQYFPHCSLFTTCSSSKRALKLMLYWNIKQVLTKRHHPNGLFLTIFGNVSPASWSMRFDKALNLRGIQTLGAPHFVATKTTMSNPCYMS